MLEKPAFIQGLFSFQGAGLDKPVPLTPPVLYQVPPDKRAQTIYFRAGNGCGEMIYVVLMKNGQAMRYFAIGAKGAMHVSLAVVEDLPPGTKVEILLGAPEGIKSSVLLDIGLMEIA